MDMLCEKEGLERSPEVSRKGGNAKAPIKDYPLGWKTPNVLVQSTKVLLVLVTMGQELCVIESALRKPFKEVSNCLPSSEYQVIF